MSDSNEPWTYGRICRRSRSQVHFQRRQFWSWSWEVRCGDCTPSGEELEIRKTRPASAVRSPLKHQQIRLKTGAVSKYRQIERFELTVTTGNLEPVFCLGTVASARSKMKLNGPRLHELSLERLHHPTLEELAETEFGYAWLQWTRRLHFHLFTWDSFLFQTTNENRRFVLTCSRSEWHILNIRTCTLQCFQEKISDNKELISPSTKTGLLAYIRKTEKCM